jgi:hypothetical protein
METKITVFIRGMDWIDLAHDRDQGHGLMNKVNEPSGFIKYSRKFSSS